MARPSFETVGSISAIVVGVVSLFVAMNEADSVRKQQAASVLPIIKINTMTLNEDDGTIAAIHVDNVGIGPAFIEGQRIIHRGEPITGMEHLRKRLLDEAGDAGFWTVRLAGEITGGGEEFVLFSASWHADDPDRYRRSTSVMNSILNELELGVCFCSVFRDCWTTELNAIERPAPISSCRSFDATPLREAQ